MAQAGAPATSLREYAANARAERSRIAAAVARADAELPRVLAVADFEAAVRKAIDSGATHCRVPVFGRVTLAMAQDAVPMLSSKFDVPMAAMTVVHGRDCLCGSTMSYGCTCAVADMSSGPERVEAIAVDISKL